MWEETTQPGRDWKPNPHTKLQSEVENELVSTEVKYRERNPALSQPEPN